MALGPTLDASGTDGATYTFTCMRLPLSRSLRARVCVCVCMFSFKFKYACAFCLPHLYTNMSRRVYKYYMQKKKKQIHRHRAESANTTIEMMAF